jgi:hypothetical protein
VRDVLEAPPHEALDRNDGVFRGSTACRSGRVTDIGAAIRVVAHHRRQQGPPLIVVQADGNATAHRGDQRIGRTEVDTDGELVLVGGGRLTGLGNLKQAIFILPATPARRRFRAKVFPGTSVAHRSVAEV